MKKEVVVCSVGGSVVNPGSINVKFLKQLKSFVNKSRKKFILVTGGGKPARSYPSAAKKLGVKQLGQDNIGIEATLLNAELIRQIFNAPPVQQKPRKIAFKKVLVAGGWKPGASSDYNTTLWAKKFGVKRVINISNTDYVYTKDPKFKSAKPLKCVSWKDFNKIIGSKWSSGMHMPFDPVASKFAEKNKMDVIFVNGKRLSQISKALANKPFVGTVIG